MQIYNNIDQTVVGRQQGEGKEVEEQEVHPVNVVDRQQGEGSQVEKQQVCTSS